MLPLTANEAKGITSRLTTLNQIRLQEGLPQPGTDPGSMPHICPLVAGLCIGPCTSQILRGLVK